MWNTDVLVPTKLAAVFAVLSFTALALMFAPAGAFALPPTGALTQLAGTDGCVSDSGVTGDQNCARGNGLSYPASVVVSPDGENIYVATNRGSGGVGILQRDLETGKLTQLPGTDGCISLYGSLEGCAQDSALFGTDAAAVSPDGNNVYVVSGEDSVPIAVLKRDSVTGALSSTGLNTNEFENLTSVAVSPDGNSVYVTSSTGSAVAAFQRNITTGQLTQLSGTGGCISDTGGAGCADGRALSNPTSVAVSPDSKFVYVASNVSDAVAVFQRNEGSLTQLSGTAGCIVSQPSADIANCANTGNALDGAASVSVSPGPDGKNVYVASSVSNAVAVFQRDFGGGALIQLSGKDGCISETGSDQSCTLGNGLVGAKSVTVSPGGNNVYVASDTSNAVAAFARRATGALTQLPGIDNCVSEGGTAGCGDGKGLSYPASVVVSPDGTNAYVASRSALAVFSRSSGEEPASPPAPAPIPAETSTPAAAPISTVVGPSVESAKGAKVQVLARTVRLTGNGIAVVRLRCSANGGDRCKGALTLKTAAKRTKAGGKRARTVTLGKGSFSIAGGKTAKVKVRLSKANRRLVAKLKAVQIDATAGFTPADITAGSTRTITLKAPKPRQNR